jgi:hypothetical protein
MWDRSTSSVLNVNQAAWGSKEKGKLLKITGQKYIQQNKGLLFIEADMWDP